MNENFVIGDEVEVLDDALKGKVIAIQGNVIEIETEEGFILNYKPNELIKRSNDNEIKFNRSVSQVLAEKEPTKKKHNLNIQSNRNNQLVFEVDLHIEKLIGNKKQHLSNFDILTIQLEEAKKTIDYAISKRYQRVVLIHGVGEGVLKTELEYLIKRYGNLSYQEANYGKYGMGATEIYIKQN
jgi:dsDNA-specific endonuclease/ATPase MutS2